MVTAIDRLKNDPNNEGNCKRMYMHKFVLFSSYSDKGGNCNQLRMKWFNEWIMMIPITKGTATVKR
jgi:hypothetical protein